MCSCRGKERVYLALNRFVVNEEKGLRFELLKKKGRKREREKRR